MSEFFQQKNNNSDNDNDQNDLNDNHPDNINEILKQKNLAAQYRTESQESKQKKETENSKQKNTKKSKREKIKDPNHKNNDRAVTEEEHKSLRNDYDKLVKEYEKVLVELKTLRIRQTTTESNMKNLQEDYSRMYNAMMSLNAMIHRFIEEDDSNTSNKKPKSNTTRKGRNK